MEFDLGPRRAGAVAEFRQFLLAGYGLHGGEAPGDGVRGKLAGLLPFGFLQSWAGQSAAVPDYLTSGAMYEALAEVDPDCACAAMIAESVVASVATSGSVSVRERYLAPLAQARLLGCVAISEPDCGSNPREMKARAQREGAGFRLEAEKLWITNGVDADLAIVVARTSERGFTRLLVSRAEHGYDSEAVAMSGLEGLGTARLFFRNTWVPEDHVLGAVDKGLDLTYLALARSRTFAALVAVGIAQAALNDAIAHARSRHQFGKPIGAHQLVQDQVARMATSIEASRLLAYRSLACMDAGAPSVVKASMAKQYATEAATEVAQMAQHIHGAAGLVRGAAVERHARNARMLTVPDGTTHINRLLIARELLGLSAL